MNYPEWLCPKLSNVPERFEVARARLGGQARAVKVSPERLSEIGAVGGRASMAKLNDQQRRELSALGGRITKRRNGYCVGEDHPRAKLSDKKVNVMRADYLAYVRGYRWVARKYGCPVSTARDIVTYRTRP